MTLEKWTRKKNEKNPISEERRAMTKKKIAILWI